MRRFCELYCLISFALTPYDGCSFGGCVWPHATTNVPSRPPWTKRRRVGVVPPSPAETTRSCRYVTLIRANISRGDQEKEQEGGKGTSLAARVEDGSVRKKPTKEETSIGRRRRYRVPFHESAARWRQHSLREALLG